MNTDDFNFLVEYAIKAPSGHNTQPWKFKKTQDGIIIHPDFKRALPVVDADNHALYISLGCALENLVIAASNKGYECIVNYPTKSDVGITVKLKSFGTESNLKNNLFDYIATRQVNRSNYSTNYVNESELNKLRSSFNFEGISIILLNGRENFEHIVPLIIEGNNLQFQNKQFVHELTSWFRYSKVEAEKKKDGLWTSTMGLPNMGRLVGNFVMKNFVTSKSEANRLNKILRHTAGLAIFISDSNDIKSWINTGRAFQRFGLTASMLGISHAHLNMPCEEISVRQKLAKVLGLENKHPLLLIRYGYSEKMPYSYRRNIEEVIIND